ncbi:MAG TPA: beta-L-arabinofuranosidase domain-containing protein [Dinghuibacter sp.]|uniref:beta-L-arabinofuranosidase domain-containing protein n=1 Tax=Dinghuibacter sp. TaxID=2024697 RepID=UPI002CDAF49D|nr:beta-L-arabinofuranosidase domain-containing protein [Dinghuibacter sp.]HTJ12797.1 beta-L-arabinofuranosidase domain-containing protein [Dinghuibacter sp.]
MVQRKIIVLTLCVLCVLCAVRAVAQDSAFTFVSRQAAALAPLPFGAVQPRGWLLTQIKDNLNGFTGHLDSLVPSLILQDDIFGSERLTKDVRHKDVGALAGGDPAAEVQYLWWNSETQGNWRDGFIRSAVLSGDTVWIGRSREYVARILSTQDRDGYIGVYDRDLRYNFTGENGELWAKTTALRGLLAWYEYTRDATVLASVERAVADVMGHYPLYASRPFYSKTPYVGGLSHGLMFTDVLEELYRLTGRTAYLDYAVFLYDDFSKEKLNEDAQYAKLIDTAYRLQGHGVHTYEHIRAVAAAAYASGNPALSGALTAFVDKVRREITPSGAPAGDEWIGRRAADATTTGYEYCSLQELLDSYADLLSKTGAASFGDGVERLFFNAAQGARDPHASCIAYLKTDNSYSMTGGRNGDTADHRQTRYKYSPVHQDVAVCCVPNAGRIAPYYISHMWMTGPLGPVATLLGPCVAHTSYSDIPVTIEERTDYPYGYSFTFVVRASHPVAFTLSIRKPSWATHVTGPFTERDGYLALRRVWGRETVVRLAFSAPAVSVQHDVAGAVYFTHGPLVLAHPIASTPVITRRYPLTGFFDYQYAPDSLVRYLYTGGTPATGPHGYSVPMTSPSGSTVSLALEPMGGTVLREVTFPWREIP